MPPIMYLRLASPQCMNTLVGECVDDTMVSTALSSRLKHPSSLQRLIMAIEGTLRPQYRDAWELVLQGKL
jgi:hypothetical protein